MPFSPGVNQNNSVDTNTTGTLALAFPADVAAGSLITVALRIGSQTCTVTSISDTRGTAYTPIASQAQTTDGGHLEAWKGLSTPGAGPNTVTIVLAGAASESLRWGIEEWLADGTQVVDDFRTGQQDGTAAPNTGGNLTPAGPSELFWAVVYNAGDSITVLPTGNWDGAPGQAGLDLDIVGKLATEYWIQTVATADDAGFSVSPANNCAVILVAFRLGSLSGPRMVFQSAVTTYPPGYL